MEDNRIAYGLAKKHGIDTKGMSPKEAWDALKKKGITRESVDSGIRKQEESKRKELEKKYEDSTFAREQSGAKSGALDSENKDFDRAIKHAELMYETYRNIQSDVPKIAKATGFSEQEIRDIKEYVFNNPEFSPDYDQAQTWDRLRKDQPIKADIIFLNHELMEIEYRKQGYSYREAHDMTQEKYNYQKELENYKNGLIGKNRGK